MTFAVETTRLIRNLSCVAALTLLVVATPVAAQDSPSDRELLNLPHTGGLSWEDRNRLDELKAEEGKYTAGDQAPSQARKPLPPLPVERNVLLGSWRVEDSGQGVGTGLGQGKGAGDADAMLRELWGMLESNPDKLTCVPRFGNGITFAPTTYSINALDGSAVGGSIAYRSGQEKVIVATPSNGRTMVFEIAGSNRIVSGGCVLVRVGAPAGSAVAIAPRNARAEAAGSSLPPASLTRPSPEVCRNTFLDKLGTVDSSQVRAMSGVRYREAAIEGKVPNTNNLRIDLRGSACDDPRLKATLYDFDANEMLQSVTLVWARPPGPVPSAFFVERVSTLSRFHSLPSPQSPGRLQADTSMGRLNIQDVPERNLMLETYTEHR